jgi:hypothetical protein
MAGIQDSRTRLKTLDVAARLESGKSAAEVTASPMGESQKLKMKNFTKEGWMWKYTKKKKEQKVFQNGWKCAVMERQADGPCAVTKHSFSRSSYEGAKLIAVHIGGDKEWQGQGLHLRWRGAS